MKFCPFVFKILSGNEILTSIKGHNSVTNVPKKMHNNPNIDLLYINAYIKFGGIYQLVLKILSERKREELISVESKNTDGKAVLQQIRLGSLKGRTYINSSGVVMIKVKEVQDCCLLRNGSRKFSTFSAFF